MPEELFDGSTLKAALQSAEQQLEAHIEELNMLNVFPVPDGDTGINMFITMQSANREINQINTSSAATISAAAARGALLGASGNSGVILSQILRGIAKGMELKDKFTSVHFAQSLKMAAELAHRAVTNPVEGTIITVSREASEMAMRMAERGASLKQTMKAVAVQAKKSVKKTPELLPQLKEAGVVDAGGKGLFYVFQGMSDYISKRVARTRQKVISKMRTETEAFAESYGFDLQFLIMGKDMPIVRARSRIEKMGDSVIVVGDERLIRVHIHTHKPDAVLKYARTIGEVTDICKDNLDEQVKEFKGKTAGQSSLVQKNYCSI